MDEQSFARDNNLQVSGESEIQPEKMQADKASA
jgi:hypothetical protein